MAHFIEDMVAENARLKAQAEADAQDRQIERQRRRDVAEANRAAYDEAQTERNRLRHGGGAFSMRPTPDGGALYSESVFGGPGEPTMRAQWADFGLQSRVGSEFADLAQRSATAQRHNSQLATDTMSAALRAAMSNGGRVPKNLMGALSRNLGMDGKTQAAFSAGLLGNGNFDIDVVSRGADGSMQKSTISLDPMQQLNLVNSTPGVWGDAGLAVTKALRERVRNTHGESEVPGLDVYQNNLKAYKTQKERADTIKMMTDLYQTVNKELSKGGKQPVTTAEIRARMADALMRDPKTSARILSVPDLNEDGTQKMIEDENGNRVPAMREADPDNPEDRERVWKNMNMQLALVPELAPRQDAQGNGETDKRLAFLKYIYDRENPQTPPDVLAFQQRQRQRQMQQIEAAQRRADITQRPQQLINYFKDGKWYSGNGYVRDGKVYDGQGYEIEGATPAEMVRGEGGRLMDDGRGGFAVRVLPSARELVGGGVGGGNAGGGAAQGTQQPAAQATQGEQPVAAQPAQGGQSQPAAAQEQGGAQQGAGQQQVADAPTQGWRPKTPKETAWVKAEIAKRKAEVGEGEKTNEQLEREAMEREESLFGQIRQNGGRLFNGEDGHRYIDVGGGFSKLPNDSEVRSKLDENGYYDLDADGHSIEDAVKLQGEVLKVVQELAKKKDDFNRRRAAAAAVFHRDALKAHPNDSKRRQEQEKNMMEGWLKDNDPDYEKKAKQIEKERRDSLITRGLENYEPTDMM